MNTLNTYEEGSLYVDVRKHWWQFWLPKHEACACYTRIGSRVFCTLSNKATHTDQQIFAMFPGAYVHITRLT